jgi:exodeoxyribonuclease V gamma subunit
MELIRSNRTENLADALASRVHDEPLGPFAQEAIVVQSRGMERWLTLALAERLGVWGNPSFPFPRAVIERILASLSERRSRETEAYDPGRLKWTVAELLRESAPAELKAYLGDPSESDRVLRLASSVSTVFDGYVVYRPALLQRWVNGEDTEWQAELWRRVVERLGPHDLATRIGQALSSLRSKQAFGDLPFERLHLFSLETLPPLFLELFSVLSHTIPTTFYLLEPSSEYVSDLDPTTRLPAAMHDTPGDGHQLISALGRLARDFQQLLLDVDEAVHHEVDLFEAPSRASLLSSLQSDILEFRSPAEDGTLQTIEATDRSISIHACTGPMREVQVLHDLIRSALEDDASLRPEDIVVMTPDLESYAPAFRAVFGQDDRHRIPYEVHDRKTRDDASFYDDFLAVLELLDSRFSVFDLVRLMDAGALRETFQFTQEERARLTELLSASGVRWGIDAAHREELEFPPDALHTWRAGLGRLFLGFASTPGDTKVFEGLLPRGASSLGDAELVARLARLCEVLFDFQRQTRRPLSVEDWATELEHFASSLFAEDDESSPGVRTLRAALGELRGLSHDSGYGGAIALKTLRRELGGLLQQRAPAVGFLRRGVTLTELVPLRSVPFRVVCLVGMSEDGFPRADDRPSFDLTRPSHMPGDRNKRDDDRHSFLQAVLCARDRVIITYSAPANSPRSGANPSPVVWELFETARRYYELSESNPVLEATVHPLHPFDARYFSDSRLPRSTSTRYLQIADALGEPSVAPDRIELSAEADAAEETLSVSELAAWMWNPMGTFLERVLRARFGASVLYEPTSALTEIGPLEASIVGNAALRAGLCDDALQAYLGAAPEFPDGNWGALERQRLLNEIHIVNARGEALGSEQSQGSRLVAADLDGLVLEARLDGVGAEQRVLTRFTKAGGRAELSVWIEHLLMQTSDALPTTTQLVVRGTETRATLVCFNPVADPRGRLKALIDLYRTSREAPVPLLGESSRLFAETCAVADSDKAFSEASKQLSRQRKWSPYLAYVFGPDDPFLDPDWREAFQRAATEVYEPLFQHRSER